MRRRRDEELYGAFDEQEDELSLEAILAEYGRGGRQPAPAQEASAPEEKSAPAETPAPQAEPEKENARLKKMVADQALDISILKEVLSKNF